MAKLPEYVPILLDGFGVRFDPSVKCSEMDRGPDGRQTYGLSTSRLSRSAMVIGDAPNDLLVKRPGSG